MIFSDPSGDEVVHPVSPLHLPIVIPPPSRHEIVHRSQNAVIMYSKPVKTHTFSKSLQLPLSIDHFYYQVKEMLDDGTTSSVEKLGTGSSDTRATGKVSGKSKEAKVSKATRYLDDGSSFLKHEIIQSEERVKTIRAGKALNHLFPGKNRGFVEPDKSFYNKQRLGTPNRDSNSKELKFYSRKRQVSLVNSSPHRPFIMLPSLKDILLHNETSPKGIFETSSSLPEKFEKLEKSFNKNSRNDGQVKSDAHDKTLMKIIKNHLSPKEVKETLQHDPISHLMNRFYEFEVGKEKLKEQLKDTLATQNYDRPEAIWLKYKHFKASEKASVYQGRMLDIWNMRMEAEKERLDQYRGMINQICWYRDLLWFTIEKCPDINHYTYYILDYIRALTQECITVTKEKMRHVFEAISKHELTNGINLLMSKILLDLSQQFHIFN